MSGGSQYAVNSAHGGSSSTFRNAQKFSLASSAKKTAGWSAEEMSTMEMKEFNGKDGTNARCDSLHVHLNPIIRFTQNCRLCQCSKRWQLAILANFGFLIVFGIRCNFGAAKNHMSRDYIDPWGKKHKHAFNWTSAELGVMESSFFYGYLITQIPAGFLAAKFPANKMFGLAIGGASFLNILLPYAFHYRSDSMIALVQIAQGLVQGFAYPAMHGVWRYWAPPLERSKLATTAFTGSYAGAVFGLPLSAWLVSYIHWSTPFYIYGIAGCIWAIFWFGMTFEKPAFHPTISAQEKAYIEGAIGQVSQSHPTLSTIPWRQILTSKPVWAIIVANFARSWNFYLLLQNQLTYMRDVLGLRISDSGFIAALPHAVMGCVVLTGGRLADYLRSNKILSTTAVRKIFNCGGFGCEALFLLVVAYTRSERTAMIALIIAVGCSGFAISGFNVNHLDIAPRYAAILMGFSNGIGTLAGLICPFVVESLTSKGNPNGWDTLGFPMVYCFPELAIASMSYDQKNDQGKGIQMQMLKCPISGVTVFLLASLIHFTGITFYAVYASGELQDWAEPKEGEEEERIAWNAEKAAEARAMDEAGKRKSSYGAVGIGTVKFEPLPAQIGGLGGEDAYYYQQRATTGQTTNHQNPFMAARNDDGQQPQPQQYSQYSTSTTTIGQYQPTWTTEENVQSNNISSANYHHQY